MTFYFCLLTKPTRSANASSVAGSAVQISDQAKIGQRSNGNEAKDCDSHLEAGPAQFEPTKCLNHPLKLAFTRV